MAFSAKIITAVMLNQFIPKKEHRDQQNWRSHFGLAEQSIMDRKNKDRTVIWICLCST